MPSVIALCLLVFAQADAQQPPSQRPAPLPTLPLTQLDERVPSPELDNRTFSLTFAQPVPVGDVLLLLVRGTSLSVVPDPGVNGSFTGELKNVTVRQALNLILPRFGLDFVVDGSFIRVFQRELVTRIFDINYLAVERTSTTAVGEAGSSSARVATTTGNDVFSDIVNGVKALTSERATFNVDRKAGLLQITDLPERLDRVASYLDAVHDRVHREVRIDARVLEIELKDPDARSIDWSALAENAGAQNPAGTPQRRDVPPSLRVNDVDRFMTALETQGSVATLARPQLLTLNNEMALVRASRSLGSPGAAQQNLSLGVTPQVAEGQVMLNVTPIVVQQTSDQPPVTMVHEADMIARVRDGETIVIAGLTRESETRERRNAGTRGGWFGRSTVVIRKRFQLLILLTPRIL
jgi:type II secretory pathway component GspD/PulD (secretin)